eukprot:CAMPEP_0169455840 /NCGR_PEP_ID=MMETSP1042-20121227/16034_1 /TAXON_ID=464988 /ORGANISM="Hemiselmis andersenii, Strain CCMP1180" /LENGTH=305 /DNA_ID=CAMNT_0009568023 /DNA_START=21 /DNA_END=935 /DNA_ORIENTATION=+
MADDREFSRPNRGNRMQLLIGEALEAAQSGTNFSIRGSDGQIGEMDGEAITYNDYFNESSDAGSYVQSEEEEDYVDSDFVTDDDAEDEDDDENENDVKDQEKAERKKASKKGAYMDPAKRAQRAIKMEDDDSDGSEGGRQRPQKAPRKSAGGDAGTIRGDRAFRSSTKQRSEMSQIAATEAAKQRQETAKSRPVSEERRYTQEELLEEAKLTAVENEKDLRRLVRIEEDMKKVVWHKVQLTGPRVQYRSTKEGNTITWTEPATMPAAFGGSAPPARKKDVCAVTGLPARYMDPVTGKPYATLAAF